MRRELAHVPPDEFHRHGAALRQSPGDVGEPKVGVECREGHWKCRDRAVDQGLAAPFQALRRAPLGLVLKTDEQPKGLTVLVAHHRRGDECWKDGAVAALQQPLRDISFGRTVTETFEDIVGRAVSGWKQRCDVLADEFVDAESHHGAEGPVDDVDAERRDIDDELTDGAALEDGLVEVLSFLQRRGMRSQSAWVEPSRYVSHGAASRGAKEWARTDANSLKVVIDTSVVPEQSPRPRRRITRA